MTILEERIFDFQIAIFSIVASLIFIYSCVKHRKLLPYLPTYIFFPIGSIFIYLQVFDYNYRLIGNIFYFLASICLILAIFYEYFQIFIKDKKEGYLLNSKKLMFQFSSFLILIFYGIQISMMILFSISIFMLIRMYKAKKTIMHMTFLIIVIGALLSLVATFLSNFDVIGMWELSYFTNIFFVSLFLIIPIVSLIENRLSESEKRYRSAYKQADFYKDILSHDINNILQIILSGLQLSESSTTNSKELKNINANINILINEVKRGATIISNLRKLSKIKETEKNLKKMEVIKILKKTIKLIEKSYQEKNINIQIMTHFNEFFILGNELLEDIFENLLINAIIHNENKNIEITIKISNDYKNNINYLKMEFLDNGLGIEDGHKPKIFKRINNEDRSIHGMGIGLSLVKQIIKFYKGKIWVENRVMSDYSQGSNFILLIPEAK